MPNDYISKKEIVIFLYKLINFWKDSDSAVMHI